MATSSYADLTLRPSDVHDFGDPNERRHRLEEGHHSNTIQLTKQPYTHRWGPYADNGGSVVAIAGEDYALVAADTRMSSGYSILSRDTSKISRITEGIVMGTGGMQSDRAAFAKNIEYRVQHYQYQNNNKSPTVSSVAQMISTMLYGRRFFPFYCFNLLAGLDGEGKGAVYGYDAVGCVERQTHGASGSGRDMIEPFLDAKMKAAHMGGRESPPSMEEGKHIALTAFRAAAERDIYTGDKVEFFIVTKDGIQESSEELRKD